MYIYIYIYVYFSVAGSTPQVAMRISGSGLYDVSCSKAFMTGQEQRTLSVGVAYRYARFHR